MVIGLRHRRAAPRGRSLCERTCRHPFPADGHSAPALSLGLPLLRPRGREKPSGWAHLPALLLGITPSFRRHLGLVTGCRGGGPGMQGPGGLTLGSTHSSLCTTLPGMTSQQKNAVDRQGYSVRLEGKQGTWCEVGTRGTTRRPTRWATAGGGGTERGGAWAGTTGREYGRGRSQLSR